VARHRHRQSLRSEIRASDAERERVVAFLRDQAVAGRLTSDELEERVGLAYGAVMRAELDRLVADLPHPPVRPEFHRPRTPTRALVPLTAAAFLVVVPPLLFWALMTAVVALGVALVAVAAALAVAVSPFVIIAALCVLAVRRHRRPLGLR
jgi:Domain of unknown function (DUF1707)